MSEPAAWWEMSKNHAFWILVLAVVIHGVVQVGLIYWTAYVKYLTFLSLDIPRCYDG
jgi:hypothetical protein